MAVALHPWRQASPPPPRHLATSPHFPDSHDHMAVAHCSPARMAPGSCTHPLTSSVLTSILRGGKPPSDCRPPLWSGLLALPDPSCLRSFRNSGGAFSST